MLATTLESCTALTFTSNFLRRRPPKPPSVAEQFTNLSATLGEFGAFR
ncbi:hypothetical protein L0337_15425 [candidate division KSB1 bacterium]|nr:hypothetical protein [candidate division KSB1 bacterium]